MTNQVSKLGKVEGKLLFKSISFLALMIAITFIGAGRIDYWQGWVYNGLNIIFILLSHFLLPPELINERLKPGKGMKRWDKIIYIVSVPVFFATLIISVFDGGRFTWEPRIPIFIVIVGIVVYSIGQIIILWAKKVNKFFSSVVRIQKDRGQTVCKSGPYHYLRHPGYFGGILFIIATPLVLGSFWGLIPSVIAVFLLVIRTYLEDETLQRELEGYMEYTNEVRYRLLPGIW
ncbi:MAG: isoprenylcysteine carboxylmethyltransferase family protein [Methanobacterium sp.]|jgi:protein-S-isoprenylcysteine O-methyltransferase Ste14